jgi:hypothetical protein
LVLFFPEKNEPSCPTSPVQKLKRPPRVRNAPVFGLGIAAVGGWADCAGLAPHAADPNKNSFRKRL